MAKLSDKVTLFVLTKEGKEQPQKANYGGWGDVDFSSLTDDSASNLVAAKFPYLEKSKKEAPAKLSVTEITPQ